MTWSQSEQITILVHHSEPSPLPPGPPPDVAKETVWIPHMRDHFKCDGDTVVIGHSSGAEAAMR